MGTVMKSNGTSRFTNILSVYLQNTDPFQILQLFLALRLSRQKETHKEQGLLSVIMEHMTSVKPGKGLAPDVNCSLTRSSI